MSDYRRPRHRSVARLLALFDAGMLADCHCYFGGGTRIALELDEYRESQVVDFLCADLAGYRTIRAGIAERSLGALLPAPPPGVSFARDVRADQYGIRTVIAIEGEPIKFEIILEGRIGLQTAAVKRIPVPVLDPVSCFAEKWLANADRWNDTAAASRDAIDIAFMLNHWDVAVAREGARIAGEAYGAAVARAARSACAKLLTDLPYRKACLQTLAVSDAKALVAGLKKFEKLAAGLA